MKPKSLSRRIPVFALRPLSAAIATAAALGLGSQSSFGASLTWLGAGGSNLWSLPANWGGAVPGSSDDAYVPSGTIDLDDARSVSSLSLGNTGTSSLTFLPGGSLTTTNFALGYDWGATAKVTLGSGGTANTWHTQDGMIGQAAGSDASIFLSGAGSLLQSVGTLSVGEAGKGGLVIQGKAAAEAATLMVGRSGAGFGEVVVSDAGSTLYAPTLVIGGDGAGAPSTTASGSVRVLAGATASTFQIRLGDAARANGYLYVDGAGSTVSAGLPVLVGNKGMGSVFISGAGRVDSGGVIAGDQAGSTGTIAAWGAGSSWISSGPVVVGNLGDGVLTVADGATVSGTSGYVGVQNGNSAANIAGAGSSWINSGIFIVGEKNGARGALGVLDGGRLSSLNGSLGHLAGSYGTMTIMGSGSNWTSAGPVTIGNEGEGRVLLMFGGTLSAPEVVIANAAGSKGTLIMGVPTGFGPPPAGVLNAPVLRFGAGDGELLFNFIGPALTYGGSIEGNGRVNIMSGDVILTGNSSNIGQTTVSGGSLAVNGSLAGPVSVGAGGTLAGSGSVGSTTLASGSTLSPGNSIGTLTVNGDLTFAPGSAYRVEAAPGSADSDRVVVNGIARLAGSVLHVGPDGNFTPNISYTILHANAIQGQFDSVASNYAFLDPRLTYGATDVTLGLLQTRAFPTGADTPNQRAVAGALESLGNDSALRQYVATLAQGQSQDVFDSLSGEVHASIANTMLQGAAQARATPLAKLRANLQAGALPGAPTAAAGVSDAPLSTAALPLSGARPAWAEVVGNWQTIDGDGNAARVRQHVGGLFVGADRPVGADWRVGGALGFTDSKVRVDERSSQADVASYSALVYGGKSVAAGPGAWQFLAGAGYTWNDISTRRYASSQTAALTADYGASTSQVFTELSYAWKLAERTTLEPFAGLAWSDLRTRGFSESGGDAALSGESGSTQQTHSTLGLRAAQGFDAAGRQGRIYGTVGWRHVFGDVKPESRLAFDAGQPFTVAGAPIGRDAALVELGAEVAIARTATLGLGYAGQYASGSREHSANVNIRWQF